MSTTMTSDEQHAAKQQVLAAFEHGCSVQNLLSTTSVPLHRATLYRLRQRFQTDPETALSDGRHGHRSRAPGRRPRVAGRVLPGCSWLYQPNSPDRAVRTLCRASEHCPPQSGPRHLGSEPTSPREGEKISPAPALSRAGRRVLAACSCWRQQGRPVCSQPWRGRSLQASKLLIGWPTRCPPHAVSLS